MCIYFVRWKNYKTILLKSIKFVIFYNSYEKNLKIHVKKVQYEHKR